MDRRREIGEAGERAAEAYLRRRWYRILARNYRCRGGEIDIVALRRATIVFVEVRTRAAGALVHPFETIDDAKRRRIVTAARHYLSRNRLHDHAVRFDVIAVEHDAGRLRCDHMENAFEVG